MVYSRCGQQSASGS